MVIARAASLKLAQSMECQGNEFALRPSVRSGLAAQSSSAVIQRRLRVGCGESGDEVEELSMKK